MNMNFLTIDTKPRLKNNFSGMYLVFFFFFFVHEALVYTKKHETKGLDPACPPKNRHVFATSYFIMKVQSKT